MKKATMQFLVSFLNDVIKDGGDDEAFIEARDEIVTELAKGEAKAQANRDLYASAHDVVIAMMANLTAPAPISEIYDEVANDLPEGMTKGKLQYAITRLWADEIVKTEGKVNAYSLKA